jgi:hypothetical protein
VAPGCVIETAHNRGVILIEPVRLNSSIEFKTTLICVTGGW